MFNKYCLVLDIPTSLLVKNRRIYFFWTGSVSIYIQYFNANAFSSGDCEPHKLQRYSRREQAWSWQDSETVLQAVSSVLQLARLVRNIKTDPYIFVCYNSNSLLINEAKRSIPSKGQKWNSNQHQFLKILKSAKKWDSYTNFLICE